jgi:hypothetical protein
MGDWTEKWPEEKGLFMLPSQTAKTAGCPPRAGAKENSCVFSRDRFSRVETGCFQATVWVSWIQLVQPPTEDM